jgi:uncharacterized protein (UPF0276 family)
VEAVTENFLGRGGRPRALLRKVRQDSRLFLHGVSLSLGGTSAFSPAYLDELRRLVVDFEPDVVSDHLSFSEVGPVHGHDLWPLPRTEEALDHVVARVSFVQEYLGRRIAVENISSYLSVGPSDLTEEDFLAELARRADCLLLLDVNNIVVSAHNQGFDPVAYLERIPVDRVAYMHVAGHSVRQGYRFDDHASLPNDEVLQLLTRARERFPKVPCIFEWDENLPSLDDYLSEAHALGRRVKEAS